MSDLNILHFNDVELVEDTPSFYTQYMSKSKQNTLRLFSGDIFSPSHFNDSFAGSQFIPFLKKL